MDIDGSSFDVIVVSTGLTECILAAALTRAGRKVLQVDSEDFYGGIEASLPLRQFVAWFHADRQRRDADSSPGQAVIGDGELQLPALPAYIWRGLSIDEPSPEQPASGGVAALEVGGEDEKCESGELAAVDDAATSSQWYSCSDALAEARDFNVDMSASGLLLCRGPTVDLLVRTGVANYMEFKSLDSSYIWSVGDEAGGSVLRVPCSKAAVFKSRAISVAEKRQLMKFLQFCLDRQTRLEGDGEGNAVNWRNEHGLNQGRSLARPQNKRADVYENIGGASGDDSRLEQISFADFLSKTCQLSPRLQSVIRYALALLPADDSGGEGQSGCGMEGVISASTGLARVQLYLSALGRFGSTASLLPLYGLGELPQAFSRHCAVHGGVFLLRERVAAVCLSEKGASAVPSSGPLSGEIAHACTGVRFASGATVHAPSVVLGVSALPYVPCGENPQVSGWREVRCVVIAPVPFVSLCAASKPGEVIAAATASGFNSEGVQKVESRRELLVLPPLTASVGNRNAVHVLQLDYGVCAAPKSRYVIHLTTLMHPLGIGNKADSGPENATVATLKRALNLIAERAAANVNRFAPEAFSPHSAAELRDASTISWSTTFERELPPSRKDIVGDLDRVEGLEFAVDDNVDAASNGTRGLELHAYHHVETARRLFAKICPNAEFFPELVGTDGTNNDASGVDDDESGLFETVLAFDSLPQPVDLTWWRWLGGIELPK